MTASSSARPTSVTLLVAAATSFVNYKDVSGDPDARVNTVLRAAQPKSYQDLKAAHAAEHQRLFRRVRIDLGASPDSALPTDERLKKFDGANDPALAALLFQFGRYVLISSSRAGTQPANLQGIWNKDMNPMWDSKYTTNINTEMNYWPAEVANLAECAEPLFRMIRELTDQGSAVAREHYGARGWVYHQNTDIWRVAAPDGRAELGRVRHRRRVAGHSPVGALPVQRRQGVSRGVLPRDEGRGGVPARFPRASSEVRVACHEPLDLAGELPARARVTIASSTR